MGIAASWLENMEMLPLDRKIWELLPLDRKIWNCCLLIGKYGVAASWSENMGIAASWSENMEMRPLDRKNSDFLDSFKSEIKNWRPQECPCKLCERYIHQVGFTQISKWFWLLTTPSTLLKKRLWHKSFPVIFVKFLRTPFLQNISGGCFSDFVIQVPPLPL